VFPVVAEVAGFASGGFPTAEDAIFPIDFGDTSPCVPGAIIEICSALHSLYPAGDGSIVIFRVSAGAKCQWNAGLKSQLKADAKCPS